MSQVPRKILDTVKYDSQGNQYRVATYVGPKVPLIIADSAIESHKNDELLNVAREHWKMLLFTNPGESISDPNFGCGIHQVLFSRVGGLESESLINNIVSHAGTYLNYMTINSVDLTPTPDNSMINIRISYSIDVANLTDIVNFQITDIADQGFTARNVPGTDIPIVEDVFRQYNL